MVGFFCRLFVLLCIALLSTGEMLKSVRGVVLRIYNNSGWPWWDSVPSAIHNSWRTKDGDYMMSLNKKFIWPQMHLYTS